MKIVAPCMPCFEEMGVPSFEFSFLEFNDKGQYEVVCNKGHRSQVILQQQKFEILFEIGANAILDGYYREAVSSFTSSLERFYEFCLQVFCKKRGVKNEVFDAGWKKVASQSERQLGAFIFMWISEFGEMPKLLPEDDIKFRNHVIHKGKIPTREEVLRYGNKILLLIREKIVELQAKYKDEVNTLIMEYVMTLSKMENGLLNGGTICLNTIISLSNGEVDYKENLEDALLKLQNNRGLESALALLK